MNWYVCCKTTVSLFTCAMVASFVASCGRESLSEESIPSASGRFSTVTDEFPGVVMVLSPAGTLCTGVIISVHAVLTAAHCVKANGRYVARTDEGDFSTYTKFSNGPGVVGDSKDIALLIFADELVSENEANMVFGIAKEVKQGDSVTLVGYGCDDREDRSGTGERRMGYNKIAEKNADFLVLLTSFASTRHIIGDESQAGTCFGDSGGPLFVQKGNQRLVAGITHAGGSYSKMYFSEFTNVADNVSNVNFLKQLNTQHQLNIPNL